MRILFMGTPDFAAVSLKRLVEDGHEICGVFTQPDKPRNRNKVTFSPVKEYALSQGLTVYQPTKLRDGTALELVKSLAPELIVVVAYGRILPKDILDVPPLGCVNVHACLLCGTGWQRSARRHWRRPFLCWRRGPPPGPRRTAHRPPLRPCCPVSCLLLTGRSLWRPSAIRCGD